MSKFIASYLHMPLILCLLVVTVVEVEIVTLATAALTALALALGLDRLGAVVVPAIAIMIPVNAAIRDQDPVKCNRSNSQIASS